MEPIRIVSKELQKQGLIDICQKGVPVGLSWVGPIRLRLRSKLEFIDGENGDNAEAENVKDNHDNEKRTGDDVHNAQKADGSPQLSPIFQGKNNLKNNEDVATSCTRKRKRDLVI